MAAYLEDGALLVHFLAPARRMGLLDAAVSQGPASQDRQEHGPHDGRELDPTFSQRAVVASYDPPSAMNGGGSCSNSTTQLEMASPKARRQIQGWLRLGGRS
jgi:hypothetical protein